MQEQGLIHIYYGDGKGKTTAAMGLAVRAAGRGMNVLVYQFMKDNDSGERSIIEQIDQITCMPGAAQIKFSFQMTKEEKAEQKHFCQEKLGEIQKRADQYDLVLLDEVICAVRVGFLGEQELINFLEKKPQYTEVVLTGNTPSEKLINMADYVTEMKKIKHPYEQGIRARTGIEK